jgi:hypothetical protein
MNLLFPGSSLDALRQHNPLEVQQQRFAVKLHYMLGEIEASGEAGIVSWRPHERYKVHFGVVFSTEQPLPLLKLSALVSSNRCFMVHDRKAFVERLLPRYDGRKFLYSTKDRLGSQNALRIFA